MRQAMSMVAWMVLMAEATDGTTGISSQGTPSGETVPTTSAEELGTHEQGEETTLTDDTDDDAESSDDWSGIAATDEEEDLAPPTGQAPDKVSETPTPKPGTTEQPAAKEEPKAAETPPKVEETPKATEVPAATKTPEDLQKEAQEAHAAYETQLADFYKLPEELAAKMETEPAEVLQQAAVKLHVAVERAITAKMAAMVPQMIAESRVMEQREQEAKQAFLGRWPELAAHEDLVFRAGQIFMQLNPTATREQRIDGVGRLVYTSLGKEPPVAGATPAAVAAPVRTAPKAGFRPAMPGTGGGAPAPKETNEFALIADEMLEDDKAP